MQKLRKSPPSEIVGVSYQRDVARKLTSGQAIVNKNVGPLCYFYVEPHGGASSSVPNKRAGDEPQIFSWGSK